MMHVRLPGAEEDIPDEHIRKRNSRAGGRNCQAVGSIIRNQPKRANGRLPPSRRVRHSGPSLDSGIVLVQHRHRHRIPNGGPTPNGVRRIALEHHVARKELMQKRIGRTGLTS